jgi:hypothetical protein
VEDTAVVLEERSGNIPPTARNVRQMHAIEFVRCRRPALCRRAALGSQWLRHLLVNFTPQSRLARARRARLYMTSPKISLLPPQLRNVIEHSRDIAQHQRIATGRQLIPTPTIPGLYNRLGLATCADRSTTMPYNNTPIAPSKDVTGTVSLPREFNRRTKLLCLFLSPYIHRP